MKYKLINKQTEETHLCEKVTIDGFDYYVSDEEPKRKSICIAKTNAVYQNNQQSLNNKLVFLDKEVINKHEIIGRVEFGEDAINLPFDVSELKKVIATNNSNIDIPQVVDDSYELANIEYPFAFGGIGNLENISKNHFIKGYNKSQETHPFSEEDIIDFAWWLKESLGRYSCDRTAHFNKEYFKLWREQRPKTVYYE